MIVTEEEAKTKWCPEARTSFETSTSDPPIMTAARNRSTWSKDGNPSSEVVDATPQNTNCIGSACMAWRWQFGSRKADRTNKDDMALGYCGKAGA